MVSLLHLLSYVGGLAGYLFVTLSLASGLLWLAELIEEHSRYAKSIGIRAIYAVITLHVLLYFTDSLPLLPILFSIFCHLVYLQNFSSSWPYISLTSLKFIASCLLVVADHFTWFFHFAQRAQEQKKYRGPKYRYGPNGTKGQGYGSGDESFMDVAAFFGICVWFVPLFLFLSLSANDNALPSLHSSAPPSPSVANATVDLSSPALDAAMQKARYTSRSSTSLVKSILTPVVNLLPRLGGRRRRGTSDEDGLIAPRTPVRGSPLHTPVNMPTPYFPWGGDDSASTSATGSGSGSTPSLIPASIGKGRPRTPPPPRRVQSEMMTSGLNPRGVATRNGVPAVPDKLFDEPDEVEMATKRVGLGVAGRQTPKRPESPSMSLGPKGTGALAGAEIVDTKGQAQPKRKDD